MAPLLLLWARRCLRRQQTRQRLTRQFRSMSKLVRMLKTIMAGRPVPPQPKFDPNARSALTTLKASEWRENAAPRRPGAGDGSMYLSDSARMGLQMAPLAGKSAKGRFQFGYE